MGREPLLLVIAVLGTLLTLAMSSSFEEEMEETEPPLMPSMIAPLNLDPGSVSHPTPSTRSDDCNPACSKDKLCSGEKTCVPDPCQDPSGPKPDDCYIYCANQGRDGGYCMTKMDPEKDNPCNFLLAIIYSVVVCPILQILTGSFDICSVTPSETTPYCYCCPLGQEARGGVCKEDPCNGVTCGTAQYCDNSEVDAAGKGKCLCSASECRANKCGKCDSATQNCVVGGRCDESNGMKRCHYDVPFKSYTCQNRCGSDLPACKQWQECGTENFCVPKQPCPDSPPPNDCQGYCAKKFEATKDITGCCIPTSKLNGTQKYYLKRGLGGGEMEIADRGEKEDSNCFCCAPPYKCDTSYGGCKCEDTWCKDRMAAYKPCTSKKGFCSTYDNVCYCIT